LTVMLRGRLEFYFVPAFGGLAIVQGQVSESWWALSRWWLLLLRLFSIECARVLDILSGYQLLLGDLRCGYWRIIIRLLKIILLWKLECDILS